MNPLPILVPASHCTKAPTNVRKRTDPTADARLKANVAARGILQNLIGLPVPRKKGHYRITGGGRRLAAVHANIADGTFPEDYQIPMLVLTNAKDAIETSLAENFFTLAMNPAEACRAFQAIIETEGKTVAGVAQHFGLTERFVLGRLRLADLADEVFDALAEGEISLDVAKAYGSTSDRARQSAVWSALANSYSRTNVNEIRRMLASYSYRAADPRVLLVGRDAYVEAGGRIDIHGDLFAEGDTERWLDTHIVDRLAEQALAKAAEELRARDGYAEVRAVASTHIPYMETYHLQAIDAERPPLTPEQEERREAIEAEIEEIEAASEDPGYEPEGDDEERVETLQAELAAIDGRPPVLGEAQRAGALAYLVIGPDGQPRLHEDVYVAPVEADDDEAGETDGDPDDGDDDVDTGAADRAPDRPAMSQKLVDELATMKTELLAAHVASDPAFALDLATFIMAERAMRTFGRSDIPSELRADPPFPRARDFQSGTAAADVWAKLDEALDRSWVNHRTIEERYDAFCALSDEARAAWLGWTVARTLHAVPMGSPGSDFLDHLGRTLEIDVAAWWRPTATNYFDRLTIKSMLALFEEIGGVEFRARYGASKKQDLAASAQRLFAGDAIVEAGIKARAIAWVPDALRFGPPVEAAAADEAARGTVDAVAGHEDTTSANDTGAVRVDEAA